MGVRKSIQLLVVLLTIFFSVRFNSEKVFAVDNEAEKYEKDYLFKSYDSDDGLEGTTANCICSDADGFLWIGGYTGLYRYDGSEFKQFLIGGRALPVNDIVVDKNDNIWLGTNGDGLYCFDGLDFKEYKLSDSMSGVNVVSKLFLDSDGIVWIGTKAGLFSIDTKKEKKSVKNYDLFSNEIIQDIAELASGQKLIVQKSGELFRQEDGKFIELPLQSFEGGGKPRCCYGTADGNFYIGTTASTLLKVSEDGKILKEIEGNGLSSFNEIYEMDNEEYWICSDTGVGLLKDDELSALKLELNDSIEEGCKDYQGNFWFVSSRQGVLQLYQNYFSDLGSYWNLKQIVNSIQPYRDRIYVGCDDGLYCYDGRTQVKDELTEECTGLRIREIYEDGSGNLWISTYQNGIRKMDTEGHISSYTTENSGLETDKIRCIWQKNNGEILIGTEEGLYLMDADGNIFRNTSNTILKTTRILDVKETGTGSMYVSTDGYGIYEFNNGRMKKIYSKTQGLLSDVVMKLVPSDSMAGIWAVTGEGVCFIDEKGNIKSAEGIPAANCLDLIRCDDGLVVVLAGNGIFEIKEEDLLKKDASYIKLDKSDGLPVDFTANARNIISDGTLYMCGTTGAVSMNPNDNQSRKPIRLYIDSVNEDGKNIDYDESGIVFSSDAHRINIDIRMINFVHRNTYATYFLKGTDTKKTLVKEQDISDISYTNLKCGDYTYQYKIYDADTDQCLAQMTLSFHKNYKFYEQFRVKILITLLIVFGMLLFMILMLNIREKQLKRQCYIEFLKEREAEISELAYKDLVTDVYNRNYFEKEKDNIDLDKMYALVSVSINYVEYFKNKYGILETENILRAGVDVIQECAKEDLKICRVSENIFYFWFMHPVKLEKYIYDIKESFGNRSGNVDMPYSFSVGAVYNNLVGKEKIDDLIERCDKMRLLDEKHAETKFIESKLKLL